MLDYEVVPYKGKIALAVLGTLVTLWLIVPVVSLVGMVADGEFSLGLALVPLTLTVIAALGTVWLWKQVQREHAAATGKGPESEPPF